MVQAWKELQQPGELRFRKIQKPSLPQEHVAPWLPPFSLPFWKLRRLEQVHARHGRGSAGSTCMLHPLVLRRKLDKYTVSHARGLTFQSANKTENAKGVGMRPVEVFRIGSSLHEG